MNFIKKTFVLLISALCMIFTVCEPVEGSVFDNGLLFFLMKICALVIFGLCMTWIYEQGNKK